MQAGDELEVVWRMPETEPSRRFRRLHQELKGWAPPPDEPEAVVVRDPDGTMRVLVEATRRQVNQALRAARRAEDDS